VLLVALSTVATSSAQESLGERGELITVDGQRRQAALVSVDAQGQCEFEYSEGIQSLPLASIVSWGSPPDGDSGPVVFLTDGAQVVADVSRIENQHLELLSPIEGNVRLPLELARGILFQPSFDDHTRDAQIEEIVSAAGNADTLVLENRDVLSGKIQAFINDEFKLEAAVGEVAIPRTKVAAAILDPSLLSVPEPMGRRIYIGLQDGSRLVCKSVLVESGGAKLELLGGGQLSARREQIEYLQPLGGEFTYLDELEPDSYRHVPYLSTSWPPGINRSTAGGQLRAAGKLYLHGIGMHSTARLTYRVDGVFRRFSADLALDDTAAQGGSVVFRVFVGNEQRFASDVVRGGQAPVPIEVDIEGAETISLVVDFADRGDELDHAAWLNARLIP